MIIENLIKEALKKIALWIDTDRKVSKITHRTFKKLVRGKKELQIREEMLNPLKEEEFEVVGEVLLYMDQNPDSKLSKELVTIYGFNEMLNNIVNS